MTTNTARPPTDVRVDPYTSTIVHVTTNRQARPNLPSSDCPFCVGGLEAPEPYERKSFPNRWPALGEGRCEVVLYSSDHDASLATIGLDGVRGVVDLWAERTTALFATTGVEFVLAFENRGASVGATIPHPHGQIYAYDHVPKRPHERLAAGWRPDHAPGDRTVAEHDGWSAWCENAPVFPISVTIAPNWPAAGLPELSGVERSALAHILHDTMTRLDHLYGEPLPYMMWLNQAPRSWSSPTPWFNIEIVSPWRARNVLRFIAAAEVACEEYFNPVDPADIAQRLRDTPPAMSHARKTN